MTSVRDPTYLLAPNWTFRPRDPIALGNIVADPLRPQHALSKLAGALPKTDTATESNWRLATEKIRSFNVSIWTSLFQQLNFELGAKSQKMEKGKFVMNFLKTVYFTDDLSPGDIRERANEIRPAYMVTGLKIAKGFRLAHYDSSEHGFNAGGGGEVALEASIGGNANMGAKKSLSVGFESANDIIFAYQLMRIKPKGWEQNLTFETEGFHHKEALLRDGDEEEDEREVEVETDKATVDEVAKTQKDVTAVDLDDDQRAWLFRSDCFEGKGVKNWNMPKDLARFDLSHPPTQSSSTPTALTVKGFPPDQNSSEPFFTATLQPFRWLPIVPFSTKTPKFVSMGVHLVQPPLPANPENGLLCGATERKKIKPHKYSNKAGMI
ncbi:hypothetical protein FGG08_004362 [Glutinoglossum americanum]|uniref:Uncharacterized protein n=1 Tax=Glutinoglossum americanum TaxID=1670608 RepID=A0A9P8I9B7_9PEZI|nr:hypothetical protein FGG08_004362 [Glutinoglossum americanum]